MAQSSVAAIEEITNIPPIHWPIMRCGRIRSDESRAAYRAGVARIYLLHMKEGPTCPK
jgi:hypothetical protein